MVTGNNAFTKFQGLFAKKLKLSSGGAAPTEYDFAPDMLRGPQALNGSTDGMVGMNHFIGTYDFAVLGGTIGTINLATTLPEPCIIMDGFVFVDTTCTGATATIALQVNAAADLLAATAVASFSAGAVLSLKPDPATAASMVLTTASKKTIQVVIATANLTAGKFRVVLRVLPTP